MRQLRRHHSPSVSPRRTTELRCAACGLLDAVDLRQDHPRCCDACGCSSLKGQRGGSPSKGGLPPAPATSRRAGGFVSAEMPAGAVPEGARTEYLRQHLSVLVDAFNELRRDHDDLVARIDCVVEQRVAEALRAHGHHHQQQHHHQQSPIMPPPPPPPPPARNNRSGGLLGAYGTSAMTSLSSVAGGGGGGGASASPAPSLQVSEPLDARLRSITAQLTAERRERSDAVRDVQLQLRQLRHSLDTLREFATASSAGGSVTHRSGSGGVTTAEVQRIVEEMAPALCARVGADLGGTSEHFRRLLARHHEMVASLVADGTASATRAVDGRLAALESDVQGLRAQLVEKHSATRRALAAMAASLNVAAPVL